MPFLNFTKIVLFIIYYNIYIIIYYKQIITPKLVFVNM